MSSVRHETAGYRPPSAADRQERELRFRRLREAMAAQGVDALLAYAPAWRRENVRYLAEAPINGSASFALLPARGEASVFSTRGTDLARIAGHGWIADAHLLRLPDLSALGDRLTAAAPARLGVAHYELLPAVFADWLRRALPGTEVTSATALMDGVRLVKSGWELDRMRRSAKVCAAAWEKFVAVLRPGQSEYGVVAAVESEIKRLGAEDNFMLIASGGDEVLGMTPPGPRLLERGDMVRTELTPQVEGYYLQLCRSAVVGTPSAGQRRSFDLFNEAVEAGLSVVKPGVTAHEVAVAENDVFRRRGYGEYCSSQWTRVRGHGHGLHPDETPIIEGNHTALPEGAVFIVHPNTYTPLAGYHVLGDPVVVTASGYEVLIDTERKLFAATEFAATEFAATEFAVTEFAVTEFAVTEGGRQ
jgi:Xaa-Pro dipeptidase